VSKAVRVALVGCGAVARHAHVPAWLALPEAELVALCDPSEAAISELRDKSGLSCDGYSSIDEMLRGQPANVIDICSPGYLHVSHVRLALAAGCHVLVEKPPCYSPEQTENLRDMARSRGLKLGAVLNYRYRDLVIQLKSLSESGRLGKIRKVHITHHGPLVYTDTAWLWDEAQSKYLLYEYGIHLLDILVHLLGPHVRLVNVAPYEQRALDHTTDLEVVAEFAGGAIGRLEITADSTRHSSHFTQINVYGTAMDAFLRWFPPSIRVTAGIVSPLDILRDEIKAVWAVGVKVLRGQFIKYRNISHLRLISAYLDWVLGRAEYPLSFDRIAPTVKLLSEIQAHVPSYHV
jgi:predicted dehydrogenase